MSADDNLEFNFKILERTWNRFGKKDPLDAILASEEKKGNKWSVDEFFQTGRVEIADLLQSVDSLGIPLPRNNALDFGCGVGRLTQALATHFKQVIGIDIASSMMKLAKKNNTHSNCESLLNRSNNLSLLTSTSFDLIYTNLVLQHMKPEFSKGYIKEFMRLLTPGGLLIFQLPHGRPPNYIVPSSANKFPNDEPSGLGIPIKNFIKRWTPDFLSNYYYDLRYRNQRWEMNCVEQSEIKALIHSWGGNFVKIEENNAAGPDWISYVYYVQKIDKLR